MRVVHVASEVAPFAQSGGLADVVAGLPAALAEAHGLTVGVVAPLYRGVAAKLPALSAGEPFSVTIGPHAFAGALRIARVGQVAYGFVDCPVLFDRAGTLYGPGGAGEFADNHLRFAVLGKVALEHGRRLVGGTTGDPFDVLHTHDWQGSLAAIYARAANAPYAIVSTIHNLAYRGIFPKAVMPELGIPWSMFDMHGIEFYDQVCLLKGGLAVSDAVTTVSPTYAREILTPERGEALDAFLRWDVRRLVGIVNGIDTHEWDPATDKALAKNFSAKQPAGKAACRAAIAKELGLADDLPLIGVIARMTGQKGIDLIAEVVPELHRIGARMIVLGSGEPDLEERFRYLATAFGDHLAVRIGFDLALSRRIYAGCDLFAMPSRFEPCGLGQLYAMRYGTIPIVHAVGGLRDTVSDPGTGIRFDAPTSAALLAAIERAIALDQSATRLAAMTRDSSWNASALQYVQLYRSLRP